MCLKMTSLVFSAAPTYYPSNWHVGLWRHSETIVTTSIVNLNQAPVAVATGLLFPPSVRRRIAVTQKRVRRC